MKSWRDGSEKSPAHRYDLALTDWLAPHIQESLLAILDTLDVEGLVDKYGNSLMKAVDPDLRAELIARILGGIHIPNAALADLQEWIAEGLVEAFATGAHAAEEQLGAHAVTTAGPLGEAVVDVDWGSWKPGSPVAVGEVAAGAMRATLDTLGITVKGIGDTILDTIGNHIADGLLAGHGSDKIARDIRELVGSKSRAERIAHTEVARAQTSASMLIYGMSGVTEYDLIISDGACQECIDIAVEGPYALTDDTGRVPIHPYCRCADSPRIESIDASLIETRDAEQE